MEEYLGKIYSGAQLSVVESSSDAHVQFILSGQAKEMGIESVPTAKESFKIFQNEGKLLIISPDERGFLNATYALLEQLGYGFYISGDVAPGHFSYFIDEKGEWWRCLWEHELEDESFVKKGNESYFQLIDEFVFELKSMHGQSIPAGYRVKMRYTYKDKAGTIEVG